LVTYKIDGMRLNIKIFFTNFIVLGLLLFGVVSHAQDSKRLDSIIKAQTAETYKNPDKVIVVGKKLLNEAGNDVDIKIRVYKLISDAYASKRDYQKSLEYVIKANELLPQSKNKRLKISIVTKTGIQYHQLKIYDKAFQYLNQAEKLCLEYPKPDSIHVSLGINYIVRGFIYKEKLNCDIAINFFDRGINEILKTNDPMGTSNALSIAKYNKGNCYLLMSDNASATKSFNEAIVHAEKIKAASLKAFAQKGLAQVYTDEGNYKGAIAILHEALNISSDVEDLILNQEIYKGLSENYLAINNWNEYQKYHSKYLQIQTEVKERERKSVSDSLNEIEKEENKKFESYIPNFLCVIISILLVLSLVVILFLVAIKKSKKTIEKLNNIVKNLQNEKPLPDGK
jgi:tetratricopeptide (TPR) repeat protein